MKEYGNPIKGMNTDSHSLSVDESSYSFAMNAMLENNAGDGFILQNDYSNILGAIFKDEEDIIGKRYLSELNVLVLFTTKNRILALYPKNYDDSGFNLPSVEGSIPLEPDNTQQVLSIKEIAYSPCFNWDIKSKVDIEHKLTDSTINLYFVDGGRNENRYIYFNRDLSINESFKTIVSIDERGTPLYSDEISCNSLKFNPDVSYPNISLEEVEGGNLLAGSYQVSVGYATSKGVSLTKYQGSTNPFPLFTKDLTVETNYNTGKSLHIKIEGIDVSSRWRWINIVVTKTINGITTHHKVATLPISSVIEYTYTGINTEIPIEEVEMFQVFPFYRSANTLTKANNKLFMTGLRDYDKYNLQPVVNTLKLKWFTITAKEGDFKDPVFSQTYRQYMRDEVYCFGVVFHLSNGETTQVFPLIGRESTDEDREQIGSRISECGDEEIIEKWQEYNTASVTSSTKSDYNKCDYKQYQEGEFGFHESTDNYPSDINVWGDLSNTKIRHFRMPDCLVSPISNGSELNPVSTGVDNFIYPLGVKIDGDINDILFSAVDQGLITREQKDRVVGYKIVRGNRVGNESIVAKGWVSDVWSYEDEGKTIYYPNYGFNDLNKDPFLMRKDGKALSSDGDEREKLLNTFTPTNRLTFHSPDTSFTQPSLGTSVKFENEIYGSSLGWFSKTKKQADYVILTQRHYNFAIMIGWLMTAHLKLSESTDPGSQGQAVGSSIGSIVGGVAGTIAGGNTVAGMAVGSGIGGVIGRLIGGMTGSDDYNHMYRLNMWISQTDRILELLQNSIPMQNYHWQYQAVGKYTNNSPIENNEGKNRKILHSSYLERGRQIVGENDSLNNNKREKSVYLHLDGPLPAHKHEDTSKFTSEHEAFCLGENEEVEAPISSFYTSIRREVSNQYGNIYNIEWIPVSGKLWKIDQKAEEFGGDKFIGRFAFKRIHNFFTNTTHGLVDREDVYYEDYHNIAYPLYFFNTRYTENSENATIDMSFLSGIVNTYPLLAALNNIDSPQTITDELAGFSYDGSSTTIRRVQEGIAKIFRTTFMNPYKMIKPGRYKLSCASDNFFKQLQDDVNIPTNGGWWKNTLGSGDVGKYIKNVQFNFAGVRGRIYTYYYAIPYFLCESDVNLDLRHATNPNEGDFYPRQTDLNTWLQPEGDYTPNEYDNVYEYNRSYSKQNKEEIILTTDINFFKDKDKTYYENRGVYSQDGSEMENTNLRDNYLTFKPLDSFDFSYESGKLISVDSIESEQVLFRFENNLRIINALNTLQTDGTSIELGSGSLFGGRPQEFSKSENGYFGTQHTDILNTEFGHIWVDCKRGNIFCLATGGKGVEELSKDGMRNWFVENLPFKILKYFPDVDVDNNYNGIGISLSFDKRYKRFFLTKLDYVPLIKGIVHTDGDFFINGLKIDVTDKRYFCNASFTISYSFYSKGWTSFHSFTPNYYVDGISQFFTGLNGRGKGLSSLWIHNLTNKSYQVYYTKLQPFTIEATSARSVSNKVLSGISFILEVIRNHNNYDRSYVENITFNKAVVYNEKQNSGLLHLSLMNKDDLYSNVSYPIKNSDSTEILIKKNENMFSFNQFTDISAKNNLPRFVNSCNNVNKMLNLNAIDYQSTRVDNNYFRSEKVNVRLINDIHSSYKFIFKGLLPDQIQSIR